MQINTVNFKTHHLCKRVFTNNIETIEIATKKNHTKSRLATHLQNIYKKANSIFDTCIRTHCTIYFWNGKMLFFPKFYITIYATYYKFKSLNMLQ